MTVWYAGAQVHKVHKIGGFVFSSPQKVRLTFTCPVKHNNYDDWFMNAWLSLHVSVPSYLLRRIKVKWCRYRPGVAQRVGRGIALLFHDRGTRRRWVVSSTPRPHFTPGKDPVPIVQDAGWAQGPVWTGGKSRPYRNSIPDRPTRSQSLYWLSYTGQSSVDTFCNFIDYFQSNAF